MKPFLRLVSASRDLLWRATRHWMSAVGVVLVNISGASFLALFAMELSGQSLGNYVGILSYIILPAVFAAGLILIPWGLYLLRKREKAGVVTKFPVFDFNDSRVRNAAMIIGGLSVVNLLVVSTATYKGVETMESTEFCRRKPFWVASLTESRAAAIKAIWSKPCGQST